MNADFIVRTCLNGTDGGTCSASKYYDSNLRKCVECSCTFPFCAYCNSNSCLLYIYELEYYATYTIMMSNCTLDPCLAYLETGSLLCIDCPSQACTYASVTETYQCNYYGYLFVNSTTTICPYVS